MADRNRALKIESTAEFGTTNDQYPVETAPNSDGLDARAFFVQSDTSADGTAYVSRVASGNDLTLTDANAGTKKAQDLVSRNLGATSCHQSLVDLIHFLDEGPGDGWASGMVLRVSYSGALPTLKVWYASASASAPKIVQMAYAYPANSPLVSSITWTLYTSSGAVARTLTDTITRSGIFVTQVVRTWT